MAQLTPNDILEISEPIEAIYQRTVDELLINIAHHFNISGWERTRYWEIKKLSELGALTKESAAIIAKNTQMLPAEIEKAFLQVSEKACLDIDPQLRQAAAKGLLQDPATTPTTSVLMRQMVQGYVDQAVDTCNMVNTTMLESTRQVYFNGVQTAVNEATRRELLNIVEAGAFEVATGTETKIQAIRKAMNAITATGITGFYDKAGRKWSAEAYTSMVIRTTAHNAAIQSVKTRQQEFGGGDIFQVSTHPAARPLCYPYQGKFFSWSTSGTFKDGAGHEHTYNYIDDSSYGEPAGLFGINCGHHPIPMIPNYSYPQDGPEMTEEQNKKAYEESQRQRQYERDIREAKRDLEIAKATGDTDAIKAAEQKVAQKQANMRAFTKETGRPRRYDREKIAGTKDIEGYKGYRAQFDSDIPLDKAPTKAYNDKTTFTKAATIDEAEAFARSIGLNVSYKGVDIAVANAMNEAAEYSIKRYPKIVDNMKAIGSGQAIHRKEKEILTEWYYEDRKSILTSMGLTEEQQRKRAAQWASRSVGRISGNTYAYANRGGHHAVEMYNGIFVNDKWGGDKEAFLAALKKDGERKFHPEGCGTIKSVFDHEMGHQIDYALGLRNNADMIALWKSLTAPEIIDGLSKYGSKNIAEFIAEGYAEYLNNPQPREIARKIGAIIEAAL
jgi:hypothetical protein